MRMRYFKAVWGRAFKRPGTDSFIGAIRKPGGFEWNTDRAYAIPENEYRRFQKVYDRAVRMGDLLAAEAPLIDDEPAVKNDESSTASEAGTKKKRRRSRTQED